LTNPGDYSISGNPTSDEERKILAAIEKILRDEERRAAPSAWKMAGRTAGIRGGLLEARHRLGRRTWTLSTRIPLGGREPPYLEGRGEAK
jgi:hypothetical protein